MGPHVIIRLVDEAASATDRAPATWARRASGSGDMWGRLVDGCDITTRRAARIVQWLSDHWPAGAEWPEELVARPAPTPGAGGNGAAPSPAAPPASLKHGNGKSSQKQADSASVGAAEPPPDDPDILDVPGRATVRLTVAMAEPDGLSEWARRQGWPPNAVHQALARHGGRSVRLSRLSERTRLILRMFNDVVERDAARARALVSSERFAAVAADLGVDLPGGGGEGKCHN